MSDVFLDQAFPPNPGSCRRSSKMIEQPKPIPSKMPTGDGGAGGAATSGDGGASATFLNNILQCPCIGNNCQSAKCCPRARCPVGSGASGAPATVVAAFARRPPFEAPVVVLDRSNENFGQNVQWPERVGVLLLGAVESVIPSWTAAGSPHPWGTYICRSQNRTYLLVIKRG